MNVKNKYSQAVKEEALRLGFDDCGIASVQFLEENLSFLKRWIRNDYHAEMNYLSVNTEKRADPAKLVEGAKSVVSVILSYYTGQKQADPSAPIISRYAYGEDYHRVTGTKLNNLLHLTFELFQLLWRGLLGWTQRT